MKGPVFLVFWKSLAVTAGAFAIVAAAALPAAATTSVEWGSGHGPRDVDALDAARGDCVAKGYQGFRSIVYLKQVNKKSGGMEWLAVVECASPR